MSRVLRQRKRVCYYEPEEPNFDEYIFCSDCGDYVYEYCSIHGPQLIIPDDKVPSITGFPPFVPRAALTIPHVFLHLAPSTIPGAELGVFSTLTLPSGVRFGPYDGIKTNTPTPGYSWQIYDGNRKRAHAIDACDANRSNWMRYVNCSRHWLEQNLVAYQYQGKLYYRTIKIIPSCTELLVFYGSEFALTLGINLSRYHSPDAYTQLVALEYEHVNFKANENGVENTEKFAAELNLPQNLENIQNHENNHDSANSEIAEDKSSIANVIKHNATENTYICDQCGKVFTEKPKLIDHIATHNIIKGITKINLIRTCKFSCLSCDGLFATKSDLINHDIKVHDSKVNYKACEKCDFKAIKNSDLIRHVRTHSDQKPYQCTVCDSKFSASYPLKVHMRIHSGEKPYSCTVCDLKFSASHPLKLHMRIHSGEKPYSCTVCDSKFSKSYPLKLHMRIHSGEKPYSCTVCDSKFSASDSLKIHMRIHSGEKPYSCTVCDSKFSGSYPLKLHMRIHSGEKPYSCTVCDSKFSASYPLKLHMRIHSGEKPYSCTVCDSKFSRSYSLKRHVKIHTGKNRINILLLKTIN
ncbi:uncharacterized protein [Choristoneura fumiferana]|uniref:uncharacterized protein n=1 Tax=Choristoneura fumiferana TaxID=7141 RepID=UPI003D15D374